MSPDPLTATHSPKFLELLPGTAHGVSRPIAPLFDRESEIDRLRTMLTLPEVQLVTVTGPGGVGKTRLALATIDQVAHRFADGVITISLAPIRNPDHVLPTIARGVGVRLIDSNETGIQLIAALREQQALLLLDNFEQVIEAAPDIALLLKSCPHLKVVITSRAPLHLTAERLFWVTPLPVGAAPIEAGDELPGAMRLFVSRATEDDPSYTFDERSLSVIQAICQRLDGLPLAIELAAARSKIISPQELLERLEPRLPMLASGSRDLPERQQTMRATIAWSHDLLSEQHQRVFRWLAIFVGGFRLRAAEATITSLCDALHHPVLTDAEFTEAIASLIAINLLHVSQENDREYRYAMLEVVREYGLEQLELYGELVPAQRAHAAWYASIREWLDPNRYAPDQQFIDHLWEIDAEHPNIRVALARSSTLGDSLRVLEIGANTAIFWHHRGFLSEGRVWLEQGLSSCAEAPAEIRCWALAGLGLICWTQGKASDAQPWLQEAWALAGTLDHGELRALSRHLLALVEFDLEDYDRARDSIEAALDLWRQLDMPSNEAMALAILSRFPPRPGEPDRRLDHVKLALRIFDSIGHPTGSARSLANIAGFALRAGDDSLAFEQIGQSISMLLSVDERWSIAHPLVTLAELLLRYDFPHQSALLLGAVDQRLQIAGAGVAISLRERNDRLRSELSNRMGAAALETALQTGGRMSGSQIETLIANLGAHLFGPSLLTRRELDVLERLAAGATDREIANELFLSHRTVHTHVSHILAKLDVSSRREAVKRARELGLLPTI